MFSPNSDVKTKLVEGVARVYSGGRSKRIKFAFVLEVAQLADDDERQPGVLNAFLFDRSALGYSSAFKSPVYDLLFGAPDFCSDGRATGAEACDDGNLDDGDGCSRTCTLEDEGLSDHIERRAIAFLRHPSRVWNTLLLMTPALVLSLLLALLFGVIAATAHQRTADHLLNGGAFVAMSVPVFWLALMLVALFAEEWHLLPSTGTMSVTSSTTLGEALVDRIRHLVLPVAVLCTVYTGRWMRYVRASMLAVMPLDYIRTARAKGLSESTVVLRHGLRNALIPIVTVVALSLPSLFGGALLTETVFSWPGIGSLQFEAVMKGDLYLAIVIFLFSAALVFAANFATDFLYAVLDPQTTSGDDEGHP